ncbi:MAG: LLM class F420-dependent oxidoreductase [Acidimicrobiales bacterium]
MEYGAVFPTTEIGDDPIAIRDYAQAVEDLGFSYLLIYDHVLGAVHEGRQPPLTGPYTERHPFHEIFVTLGFLAGVTRRLGLATGVVILPQRQTVLAAKQAAEVDVLSGGRLRLGLGTGWNTVEYDALGVEWDTRGPRFDEQVELMRRLWSEPVVDYTGRFHRVDRGGIAPRPARPIPLWFGGFAPPAIRRAARVGDGFFFANAGQRSVAMIAELRRLLTENGRDPAGYPIELQVDYGSGEERWRRVAERARENGVTHLACNTMSTTAAFFGSPAPNLTSPDQHVKALESFLKAMS